MMLSMHWVSSIEAAFSEHSGWRAGGEETRGKREVLAVVVLHVLLPPLSLLSGKDGQHDAEREGVAWAVRA
jgi:hypothetical protein